MVSRVPFRRRDRSFNRRYSRVRSVRLKCFVPTPKVDAGLAAAPDVIITNEVV